MRCDCYCWYALFLGRVFRETLCVFTGLPYHSVIPLCVMTALYADNQAPGLGLSGSQHSFSVWKVWKSQLSPNTDGVHHSEIQHSILNLSVMSIFLKMQSIQWQWRWWKRAEDWEVYLVILCSKSHRSCSSRVNNVSWQGSKQRKGASHGIFLWWCYAVWINEVTMGLWLLLILCGDLTPTSQFAELCSFL